MVVPLVSPELASTSRFWTACPVAEKWTHTIFEVVIPDILFFEEVNVVEVFRQDVFTDISRVRLPHLAPLKEAF